LASADGIVMNTPEAAARVVEEFQELRGTPIVSILNGYDAADFEAAELRPDDGRFRIVHTGSLHSAQRARGRLRRVLGGGDEGVDVGTRSLRFLLKAIDELPEALQEKVQIHVAGRLTDLDRASFEGRGNVHEHGFLAHRETLALMRTADLLFLPMHDVQPGRRVAIVPCKTYEYLGSQRPILAAVPEGDARDMLMEAGNAFVCRPKDVEGMRAGLVEAIDRWAAGTEPPAPSASLLQRVERRHLTRSVADFLDTVAGRSLDRGAVAELA
jgi:glycosyltransferase involved in cell wall biosynthesis